MLFEGGESLAIALAGTGVMGSAVGHRILQLGFTLRVYNRTFEKTGELVRSGAQAFRTAQEAARGASILVTVVTDSHALGCVLFGENGAMNTADSPPLAIDLGTHYPAALASVAERVAATGADFVEAPVTGSVHDASHGTLCFFAGGDTAAVARARPFLEAVGSRVYHMGPPGSGNTAKLALNVLVGAMAFGLAECVALLEAAHLNVPEFLDALSRSGLRSPLYERIGQRYLARDHTPRYSLRNLEKDLAWAAKVAGEHSCPAEFCARMASYLARLDAQTKELDYSAVLGFLTPI